MWGQYAPVKAVLHRNFKDPTYDGQYIPWTCQVSDAIMRDL